MYNCGYIWWNGLSCTLKAKGYSRQKAEKKGITCENTNI